MRFFIFLMALSAFCSSGEIWSQSTLKGPLPANNIGATMYAFDVTASKHIEITDFSVKFTPFAFPNVGITVYRKIAAGGYAGALGDIHAWEVIGATSMPWSSGQNPLNLGLSEFIPMGETAAFMIVAGAGFPFSILGTIPTGAVAASNADLTLHAGDGSGFPGFYLLGAAPNTSFTGTLHYNVLPQVGLDLAMDAILTPSTSDFECSSLSNAEVVTVRARNMGSSTIPAITFIQFSLDVDGQTVVSDQVVLPNPVAPGGTFTHAFSIAGDFSNGFAHTAMASLSLFGDLDSSNDSLTKTVQAGGLARATGLPFVEDFSYLVPSIVQSGSLITPGVVKTLAPPPGWYQDPNDSSGLHSQWQFGNNSQGEVFLTTYPSFSSIQPPTGSPYYVRLVSPCIDLGQAVNPRLSFGFYNELLTSSLPPTLNTLSVDVIRESTGVIDLDVDGPVSEQLSINLVNAIMRKRVVDLSAYAGDVIRLVFRADLSLQFPSSHPSIDNVRIEEAINTPGQNQQPGFSVFYLDDELLPLNAMGDELYVETGGPYLVTKSAGDFVSFSFRGQANEPIIFLAGPMNPAAATFPIIGQMDIGGNPDPMTGIPVGIQVLADGTQPFGLGGLFILDATGARDLWFTIPPLPSGPHAVYQAALLTGGANGSWVALSNAIELDIQ